MIGTPFVESYEKDNSGNRILCTDYQQAKVSGFTLTLTPGPKMSERAGRYAVAVCPLTLERSQEIVNGGVSTGSKGRTIKTPDSFAFGYLLQYPNAIVCSAEKPFWILAAENLSSRLILVTLRSLGH